MKSKKTTKGKFRLIHLIILLLIVYVIVVFNHQRKLFSNLESKRELNEAKIEELEEDIGELNEEIETSDSLEFVEKIARDELGMVKPREIIYIDVNKSKKPISDIFNRDK